MLDREEYVEQTYLFRILRERLLLGLSTQELLDGVKDELLATTKLPIAVEYLAGELRLKGVMAPAMARLGHYFTPFQTAIVTAAENDRMRFDFRVALEILEHETAYRASGATPQGLFLYQFECVCRNRLGYDRCLDAMSRDPMYDADWRSWITDLRSKVGIVESSDLIYFRSQYYVDVQLEAHPDSPPPTGPILFGVREGKIALANRGKDPLFLFSALERQLGYPHAPRPKPEPKHQVNLHQLLQRLEHLELRLRLLEEESKGGIDLSKLVDLQKRLPPDDEPLP